MSATDASQQANRAGMDPRRLVVIGFLVLGIVAAMFLGHLFTQIADRFSLPNPEPIDGVRFRVTDILGFLTTVGIVAWMWWNEQSRTLSLEVASELMKVTWPSWDETRVSTVAVVVACLVAAGLMFVIDWGAYKVMVKWIPHVWGMF